jgi:hypothetical protein
MRLPLTLSIAVHAIVLVLLTLLVAESRPPPEPPVKSGIEVALGQSLAEQQMVLAPEAVS